MNHSDLGSRQALKDLGLFPKVATVDLPKAKTVRTVESFQEHLEPGDILITSMKPRKSESFWDDPLVYPLESVLRKVSPAVQKSEYTHSALYLGDGNVLDHRYPRKAEVKSLGEALTGVDAIAVRPKVRKATKEKAVKRIQKNVGKDYSLGQFFRAGLAEFIDIKPVEKESDQYICSNIITDAYKGVKFHPKKKPELLMPSEFLRSDKTKPIVKLKKPKEPIIKLSMQLSFDTPQQAMQHHQRRNRIGQGAGLVGSIGGGVAGGIVGGALGGPVGGLAGGLAGGYLGEKAWSMPATTAYDAAHDVSWRTKNTYNKALTGMNQAAGMPSGVNRGV